jgi:hypothetical protein
VGKIFTMLFYLNSAVLFFISNLLVAVSL